MTDSKQDTDGNLPPSMTPATATVYPATSKIVSVEGDLRELPRLHKGLVLTVLLSALAQGIFSFLPPGLARELWIHLPMQFYWTFCLFRLSQVMGKKYGDRPPFSDLELGLLSLLSFVTMPIFDHYHFQPRLLDPIFICWLGTQVAWTARLGTFLERKENPKRAIAWRMPLTLTAGANAYLLAGAIYPLLLSLPLFFNSMWFVSQFWCILFLILKLKDNFETGKAAQPVHSKQTVFAGGDVVIRYRAFAAIERWFQQRLSKQNMRSGAKLIFMWFIAPFLLIGCLGAMAWLLATNPSMQLPAVTATGTATAAAAAANVSFIKIFLSTLGISGGLAAVLCLRQPTHIGFSAQGFRFLWRHKAFQRDGFYTLWKDIAHIAVDHRSNKTSALDTRLCFIVKDGKKQAIKLSSIDAVEDREAILNAIKRFAPHTSRDALVEQTLQPPQDYSYTELWLQALSAPPKRERLQPLLAGVILKDGRYQALSTLGAGGQGQAYLAIDRQSGAEIVLKEFILPVYVDVNIRRNALEQFENEARILRQMDNPQIVKLLDFFIEDHRAYLVLEHIEGGSLRQIVKNRGHLPENQVRMLASQMCEILSYLHGLSPPVVHRDFTPDNLILNKSGTLKLIDFNVARQVVESTTSGTVVGKQAYLPPEQFRGMPVTQSDIYALGATLHFLLVGEDPVPISVSHPRRVCPEVSEALNFIVEHATALDLPQRYDSVAQLQDDLNKSPP